MTTLKFVTDLRDGGSGDDVAEVTTLERRAVRLVLHENRLLDQWRLEEWLELWSEDGIYWVPIGESDVDPRRTVSIIYDDYSRLQDRVYRLTHAGGHSQEPRSRTNHMLTNFEVGSDPSTGTLEVQANLLIAEARRERQTLYPARVEYVLESAESPNGQVGLRIRHKKVVLLANDHPLGNLTFAI